MAAAAPRSACRVARTPSPSGSSPNPTVRHVRARAQPAQLVPAPRAVHRRPAHMADRCAHVARPAARTEGGQVTVFGKGGKTDGYCCRMRSGELDASLDASVFASRRSGGHLHPTSIERVVWKAAQRARVEGKVSPPLAPTQPCHPCARARGTDPPGAGNAGAGFFLAHLLRSRPGLSKPRCRGANRQQRHGARHEAQ
jgi:hypothetical protein